MPLSSLEEQSPLLTSLTSRSSKSLSLTSLLVTFSLPFFNFLISSLILIIPSALPILLIFSVVDFPSFWKSGATLCVSRPFATIIAVMISVASIMMSTVTPLSFSCSITSRPSRMSSPSSTKIELSFSIIHSMSDVLTSCAFSGHANIRLSFSITSFSWLSFHFCSTISMPISILLECSSFFQPSGS